MQDSVLTGGLGVSKVAFACHWIPPCLLGATPHRPVRAPFTHTVPHAEPLLPAAVHWRAGVRVGEREVAPLVPARGSLGPRFPTFSGTMRRYDCHQAPLGSLRMALASRSRACFPRSWSPRRARCLVEAPRPRQGLGSPGPPLRAWRQGDRWRSHVPAFPLCRHAPLSDPGGVLRTRPRAPRTAAFRRWHTVGLPLAPRLYPFRGSITRPACSLPPASYGP